MMILTVNFHKDLFSRWKVIHQTRKTVFDHISNLTNFEVFWDVFKHFLEYFKYFLNNKTLLSGKIVASIICKREKGDSSLLQCWVQYLYYLSGKTWSDRPVLPRGKQRASDETIKKVILCLHDIVYMGVRSSTWQLCVQHAVMACRILLVSVANIHNLRG